MFWPNANDVEKRKYYESNGKYWWKSSQFIELRNSIISILNKQSELKANLAAFFLCCFWWIGKIHENCVKTSVRELSTANNLFKFEKTSRARKKNWISIEIERVKNVDDYYRMFICFSFKCFTKRELTNPF